MHKTTFFSWSAGVSPALGSFVTNASAGKMPALLLFISSFFFPLYAYDLSKATVEKLDNGLTVMILEDHLQPLVSTQMLYKSGSRNECDGATGLAHFVEHMAFRGSQKFPQTGTARIYAIGGEWHGYTWIDQTTYFETVPVKDFELALEIQADRMNKSLFNADEVEAERGAVITELHSYENDPATLLSTATIATSFLQHPYRYDTIGWLSDLQKITHSDLVAFYRRYYNPSNAVLAIAGDVNPSSAMDLVRKHFSAMAAGKSDSMPRTIEMPQKGERRVTLEGQSAIHYFQIVYRAPSASDPDFSAFLVLQAILGGNPGVNIRQKLEAETARPDTLLHGIAKKIGTFFIPTADPYVFVISGQSDTQQRIEEAIEKKLKEARDSSVSADALERAKSQVLEELVFDIETTEDAAHQMAYFEGIGAFQVLQQLPEKIRSVSADDIQRDARKYLQPSQKTVGWYVASEPASAAHLQDLPHPRAAKKEMQPLSVPQVRKLPNGVLVIAQSVSRTPAGFIRAIVPSNVEASVSYTVDTPVWRHTSVHQRFLKEDAESTLRAFRKQLDALKPPEPDATAEQDPEYRLHQAFQQMLGVQPLSVSRVPAVISVVGDIDSRKAMSLLSSEFGSMPRISGKKSSAVRITEREKVVKLPGKAQSQFGYAIPAPPPADPQSYAYKLLLYIMTHGYEGRLGNEMIGKQGLLYYISSMYQSDGAASWLDIHFGVDPDKLEPARAEFTRILQELKTKPPTQAELDEAKSHLIGRRITAYQSNEELSMFYVREVMEQGRLLSQPEFEQKVRAVTLSQIQALIPKFLNGGTAVVDTR